MEKSLVFCCCCCCCFFFFVGGGGGGGAHLNYVSVRHSISAYVVLRC